MERKNNPRQNDPNRPMGTTFNYVTGQYEPSQDLSVEDQNQDLARSLGVLPNYTPVVEEVQINQEPVELEQAPIKPTIREEIIPFAQPQVIPKQMDLPQDLPTEAPTQQPDLQQLISEYANAARESANKKRNVALTEGLTATLQGLLGATSETNVKLTPDAFRRQYEMAEQPIEELEIRDRGTATQQKLTATQLDLQNAQQANDRNSVVSEAARNKDMIVMQQMGRPDLAEKIAKNKMSAVQLNSLFGNYRMGSPEPTVEQVKKDPIEEFKSKEEAKEDIKIKAENRKVKKDVEKNLADTQNLLKDLERTKQLFNDYSKNTPAGTGPLATGFGLTKYTSDQAQNLDAQFKKLNLDSMVKMFAGMSKAVDSDAERRAFEAAQPALTNDDTVNRRLIDERIEAAKSLVNKLKQKDASIDRAGNFVTPEQTTEQKTSNKPAWAK